MSIYIKTVFAVFSIILNLIIPLVSPKAIFAQNINIQCSGRSGFFANYVKSASFNATENIGQGFKVKVTFNTADPRFNYYLSIVQVSGPFLGTSDIESDKMKATGAAEVEFNVPNKDQGASIGGYSVRLMHSESFGGEEICTLGTINLTDGALNDTTCNLKMPDNVEIDKPFSYTVEKKDNPALSQKVYFYQKGTLAINKLPAGLAVVQVGKNPPPIAIFAPDGRVYENLLPDNPAGNKEVNITFSNTSPRLDAGEYTAVLEVRRFKGIGPNLGFGIGVPLGIGANGDQRVTFGFGPLIGPRITLVDNWYVFYCSYHHFKVSTDPTSAITGGIQITPSGTGGTIGAGKISTKTCLDKQKNDPDNKCAESGGDPCDTNGTRGPGIKTAIGCVHTNPAELTKDVLTFVLGIGGGIAFLMMLLGAFQMLTSAGNPETLNAGRERLTSAMIGLLLIIFAVLLMQIIGVGILNLPGFGK